MNKAIVELIPLHSFATSTVTPGTVIVNPSRKTGTLKREKMAVEREAEPDCNVKMTWSKTKAGTGSVSASNENAKEAFRRALVPKMNAKPDITNRSTDETVRKGARPLLHPPFTKPAKSPAMRAHTTKIAPNLLSDSTRENMVDLLDHIKYVEINGIRTMWEL